DVTHVMVRSGRVERRPDGLVDLPLLRPGPLAVPSAQRAQRALARLAPPRTVRPAGGHDPRPAPHPHGPRPPADAPCTARTAGPPGPSTGVLSPHCHVVSFSLDWIKVNHYGEDDVTFCPMPLFHALGSWLGVLPAVICGARIALQTRFSASSYWADVKRHGASI